MEEEPRATPRPMQRPRTRARTQSFFEFDTLERRTLTLSLSTHDPRDALFLGPDGIPRYRVATRIVPSSSVSTTTINTPIRPYSNSALSKSTPAVNNSSHNNNNPHSNHGDRKYRSTLNKFGIGTTCEVTSIYRIRKPSTPPNNLRRAATTSGQPPVGRGRSSSISSSRQSSRRAPSSSGDGLPLSPISEGEDQYPSDQDDDDDDDDEKEICVATIERKPFSFSPVVLHFNGKSGPANEYLRRGKLFSR